MNGRADQIGIIAKRASTSRDKTYDLDKATLS